MIRRPLCRLCPHAAVLVDVPVQATLFASDQPWCAAHAPRRPEPGFERIRLDETRAKVTEAKST